MTTRPRSAVLRLATAALLAIGLTGLPAGSAGAAASCAQDGSLHVTVTLTGGAATVTGFLPSPGAGVEADGSSCGAGANGVTVTGASADDVLTLDLVNGPYLSDGDLSTPGLDDVQIDLGAGHDTLVVKTRDFADTVTSTSTGFRLAGSFQDIALTGVEAVTFDLGAGDDTIDLSADPAYAIPTTIQPGTGADTVTGGAGDDVLVATPPGATADTDTDVYSGGDGIDTIDYSDRVTRIWVDLTENYQDGSGQQVAGETDTVVPDVEVVRTGSGDDRVFGSAGPEDISTGEGADLVLPGGGDDRVALGGGADILQTSEEGDGADTYTGDVFDTLDYVGRTAPVSVDLAAGEAGAAGEGDVISGFGTVRGGNGNDVLLGSSGMDRLIGGPGNDVLDGRGNADILEGEEGNDRILQGSTPDGTDQIFGGPGSDVLDYSSRTTAVTATIGGIGGGAPTEQDEIDLDVEELDGGSGNDVLTGSTAANTLRGGPGNDVLTGGLGNDRVYGDSGNDRFPQGGGPDGNDTVSGGSGTDIMDYALRTTTVAATLGGRGGAAGEADVIGADVEWLYGGRGNDTLVGSSAANLLHGNAGNDVLRGAGGDDLEYGDAGNDVFLQDAAANGADTVYGGSGVDRVDYGSRRTAVKVTLDNRADDGSGERDNVRSDVENVRGGAAADTLTGSSVVNLLEGLAGNDVLDGKGGRDTLSCGAGKDRAVKRTGAKYSACETVR